VVTIGVKKSSKHRDTRSSFKDDVLIKSMVQAGAKLGKKIAWCIAAPSKLK
jgi:hypothetical protein